MKHVPLILQTILPVGRTNKVPFTEVTKDEFYKWIDSSVKKTKPFSEYKSVNPVQLAPSIESANADRMKDIETRLAEIEGQEDRTGGYSGRSRK